MKYCPRCGFRTDNDSYNYCPRCSSHIAVNLISDQLDSDNKLIPHIERLEQIEGQTDEQKKKCETKEPTFDSIKNCVVLGLETGEIARRISVYELEFLSDAKGVYVQEGVMAVLMIDGRLVTRLTSGVYYFKTEIERFGDTLRHIWRFFTGKKENGSANDDELRSGRLGSELQNLGKSSLVDVVLFAEGAIPVVFGIKPTEEGHEFEPFNIHTKYLDVKVAVSMHMEISDFASFRKNYLTKRPFYRIADLQIALMDTVRNLLQEFLFYENFEGSVLCPELKERLRRGLTEKLNTILYGISVRQVLDITIDSADFARFREIEHKLYCSNKELAYLIRTNDFKNRLASEENSPKVREARSEEDLRYALMQLNKDALLHDDEMEAFSQLLASLKAIREAKTEADTIKALVEIKGDNPLITEKVYEVFVGEFKRNNDLKTDAFRYLNYLRVCETLNEREALRQELGVENDNDAIIDIDIPREDLPRIHVTDWDTCPRCGHRRSTFGRPFDDPDHCSECGAAYPVYTPEVRELRKNQTKEELIEQLKDISHHWVDAPFSVHRNAMCYSITPPHEDYVKCEECGKVIQISSYLNNDYSLARIVQSINELGYDATIKGLCKECAEKKGIEPMLLHRGPNRGEYDNGQYFHLFAFKTKETDEYTYSITNDTLDYCVLEAFLENKTTLEYDEKIIRVKDELSIIQMMSGLSLTNSDVELKEALRQEYLLKQELLSIAKQRDSCKEEDLQRKRLVEAAMKRIREDVAENKTDMSSLQTLEEIMKTMKEIAEHRSNDPNPNPLKDIGELKVGVDADPPCPQGKQEMQNEEVSQNENSKVSKTKGLFTMIKDFFSSKQK